MLYTSLVLQYGSHPSSCLYVHLVITCLSISLLVNLSVHQSIDHSARWSESVPLCSDQSVLRYSCLSVCMYQQDIPFSEYFSDICNQNCIPYSVNDCFEILTLWMNKLKLFHAFNKKQCSLFYANNFCCFIYRYIFKTKPYINIISFILQVLNVFVSVPIFSVNDCL